jgi:hypothetical protein
MASRVLISYKKSALCLLAGFLNDKSTLDTISRVVSDRVEGALQLTVDRVMVYKNMSGQERGYFRIIPPLRNQPPVFGKDALYPGREY